MEKQLYAKNSTHNNTPFIERIFTEARGVHLFPEEKAAILKSIQTMQLVTAPIVMKAKKEKVH